MGLVQDILLGRRTSNTFALGTWQTADPPLTVQQVTLQSLYPGIDADELPMFREEAQTLPEVMAIQNLLTATIGTLPLQGVDATGKLLPVQPAWANRMDAQSQNPMVRMQRTVMDILYNGQSLWQITAKDSKGYPLSMRNVWHQFWNFDPQTGIIYVNSQAVDPSWYVLFESAYPGLLTVGGRTLRTTRDIHRTIRARARVAMPTQYIQNNDTSGNSEPDDEELQGMLTQYTEQRRSRDGAVAYVPGQYSLKQIEDSPNSWLLEARSGQIADFAKLTGVPSGLIEGAQFGSLNYSTELGQLSRFTDFNIRQYLDPITSRLSMGDVTPNGTSIKFDVSVLQQQAPEPLTDKGAPVAPNTKAPEVATAND